MRSRYFSTTQPQEDQHSISHLHVLQVNSDYSIENMFRKRCCNGLSENLSPTVQSKFAIEETTIGLDAISAQGRVLYSIWY